jgi:DNA-binding CsgD family transcriptional regulator
MVTTVESIEIKALEEKILALEERCRFLQEIVDCVPANIYITELDKGVVWCNKTNEETLGYTIDEIKNMGGLNYLYQVVHPDDYNVPDQSIVHFNNNPVKQYGGVFRCKHKDTGLYKWFIGWGKVISNIEQEELPLRILNVDVDLSPQMDTDIQLRAVLAENLKLQHQLILDALSKREIEVLTKICKGLSSKEIAEELFLSKHTIETHRKNVQKKLKIKNMAALVLFCKETGLV